MMRHLLIIFLIGLLLLIGGVAVWNRVMTTIIMAQRDRTMQVIGDAQPIVRAIYEADSERESNGLDSIYPRDLGITTGNAYLNYLQQQGIISDIPETIESMKIANVSRSDSADTIFLISTGTMRDIHSMIHNIGSYPNYKKGYISLRKNATGQFYESTVPLSSTGRESPREPQFLEKEK